MTNMTNQQKKVSTLVPMIKIQYYSERPIRGHYFSLKYQSEARITWVPAPWSLGSLNSRQVSSSSVLLLTRGMQSVLLPSLGTWNKEEEISKEICNNEKEISNEIELLGENMQHTQLLSNTLSNDKNKISNKICDEVVGNQHHHRHYKIAEILFYASTQCTHGGQRGEF